MKSLNTLIKLNKQQLDALRRRMVTLEGTKAQLLASIERLKKELAHESQLAREKPEIGRYFGEFARGVRLKEDAIREKIQALEKEMEGLREEIRLKFSELKKFEIAREQYLARQKEELARRETEQLDEIAIQQFARQEE